MELLNFFYPQTLEQVKEFINKNHKSKILAGGTDLVLELRKKNINKGCIVALNKISELKGIEEDEECVVIGAMVTFDDLIESDIIKNNYRALINCSRTMGSPQIRNVATVGGNIVNAGSAADVIPCIISLGGILIIESLVGVRKISCEDYFENYNEEKVKDNEILTKIVLLKGCFQSGYYKLGKRNSLAIARVNAAVKVEIEESKIRDLKICIGAVGRYPFRVNKLEEQGMNKGVQWLFSEEALSYLESVVEQSIGGRRTMPFKREAIKGVFKEALTIALNE